MSAPPPLPLQEETVAAASSSSTHHRIESDPRASPFERARAAAAAKMCGMREMVTQLDNWETGADPIGRVALHSNLRQEMSNVRRLMQEARRASVMERRSEDYKVVEEQLQSTEKLVQSRLRVPVSSGATLFSLHEDEHDTGEPAPGHHYSLRQDEDFLRFFESTREKDVQMDQALDRIHEGVLRIHDNAQNIGYELDMQNELLDRTEKQVDDNHDQVHGLNKKLRKTIHKLGKSRIIIYCACCVIFIVLVIVIAFLAKSL